MNRPLMSLVNLSKAYKIKGQTLQVLENVHFEIPRGTSLSIVGPSGAGKSTLLYLLGMLSTPDSGRIFLEGRDVSMLGSAEKARIRNRDIGFIFQSYHLLPEFNALENIMIPCQLLGISRKESRRRAMDLLEKVNLSQRAHHKPSELSGGEQQRICICRALINNPRLILADEPTGNLDTKNSELVEKLLESLCNEHHTTLVLVTHNEELAQRAQLKISLRDGKIRV